MRKLFLNPETTYKIMETVFSIFGVKICFAKKLKKKNVKKIYFLLIFKFYTLNTIYLQKCLKILLRFSFWPLNFVTLLKSPENVTKLSEITDHIFSSIKNI